MSSPDDDGDERLMDLADASQYRFGTRFHHYLQTYGGKDPHKRAEVSDLAFQAAMEEMMDEQHAMLFAICEKLGIKVG